MHRRSARTFILDSNSELRVEVPWSCTSGIQLSVSANNAEIFGCELYPGTQYTLGPGTSTPVYSYNGCTLQVEGDADVIGDVYASSTSSTRTVLELHCELQRRRKRAQEREEKPQGGVSEPIPGPRILVTGSPGSGKSSICRTLCSYSVRGGYPVTYVDCTVSAPTLAMPECVAAATLNTPVHPIEGFEFTPKIEYSYGCEDVSRNAPLLRQTVKNMNEVVVQKLAKQRKPRWGGLIIDGPSPSTEEGFNTLCFLIQEFDVDMVLTVADDRLRHALKRLCTSPLEGVDRQDVFVNARGTEMSFLSTEPVEGVMFRTDAWVAQYTRSRWLRYFTGSLTSPMRFKTISVKLSDITLVKVGGVSPIAMHGILPIGEESLLDPADVYVDDEPSSDTIAHRIAAVALATRGTTDSSGVYSEKNFDDFEQEVKKCCVLGFAYIQCCTETDITLKIPCSRLPQKIGTCLQYLEAKMNFEELLPS